MQQWLFYFFSMSTADMHIMTRIIRYRTVGTKQREHLHVFQAEICILKNLAPSVPVSEPLIELQEAKDFAHATEATLHQTYEHTLKLQANRVAMFHFTSLSLFSPPAAKYCT